MLALNKKVGLLSIQSAKLWKVLYFDHRGVTLHHNVHRVLDRVVAAFVRSGRLAEATLDEVRDHAARMGQALADSLLAGGYLEAGEMEDQYRLELEEEIYDLFFCRDAKFEFHEGATSLDGRDGSIDERFFSNCDSVIMEAARRIDEWTYISERVPTTAEVLVATADSIDGEQFGSDGPAVFELLDGRRNVARIVELTGLSNFLVCKALSQMLDAQVIAPVAVEELLPLAEECMSGGRLPDAISLYERAIECGVGLPDVHHRAAAAYQSAEQYENATYHLECEAEHRLAAGDRAAAARCLFEVRQSIPTDLQARERLVELTLGPAGVAIAGFDPMAEGKELVELLIEFGDIQRVRTLLERLLLVAPDDPDLKKALVNVHVKAGDQKRVAELYESIADDLVRQQKPLEAVAYLQKILLIDRGRSDVSDRVRKLYEYDERSRRRGRALSVLAALFCLLLVLGSGYWFYNERAEEEFGRIDVHELVQREDFAGATAAYEQFTLSHPFSTAVARAKAELLQIEAARQRFEARRASERAERGRQLQKQRDDYKLAWTRHREQFLAGQPEASLESLEQARQLVAAAGTPDDMAWALEQQVERTWVRLRDYLAEAAALAAEFDRRLQSGDWQAARELSIKLHRDYENTRSAANVRTPVMVTTRPAGAQLLQDGKPLTQQIDGTESALQTPALVWCKSGETVALVARRPGFDDKPIVVDPAQAARLDVVLEVVAERRLTFPGAVQTGLGLGEGWLVAGVRGGRLGIARGDGSNLHVRELGGLRAVDSTPQVQNGRVFFTTNENTIECLALDGAVAVSGWPVALPSGAATDLLVAEGRVAVVDRDGVLQCWEQATARRLWSVALEGQPAGPPTIDRRQVHIGLTDGRVLLFDAADGSGLGVLRSPTGVVTRVLCDRGMLWFGGSDGNLRAVEAAEGRVAWTVATGRLTDGLVALGRTSVLVVTGDGRLLSLDRATGRQLGELKLDGEAQPGLRVAGNRAIVVVRRPKSRTKPPHDVLIAVQIDTTTMVWEYAEAGILPGTPAIDDFSIALPSVAGEVVLFR
jgi:outer membrane protein assembly factor BamB/tetratricopeptide (TPR) repeat protein